MMKARFAPVLMVCILLLSGAVVRSEPNLPLLIDHQQVDIPVKLEDGRAYVPLRSFAEKLGIQVIYGTDWNGEPAVNLHTLPDTFLSYDRTYWRALSTPLAKGPTDLAGVGAGAAVSKYLAEEQLASLKQDGPVLVRFDLLDYRSRFGFPPYEIKSMGAGGFAYAVRLFYVQRVDNSAGLYSIVHNLPESSWTTSRPNAEAYWYEDIIIDVVPDGDPIYVKTETKETATWGNSDWVVVPESRRVTAKVTLDESPYVVHGLSSR